MAVFAPLHRAARSRTRRTCSAACSRRPGWTGGDWSYPLGCDALGRDILSRIIYGARISIFVGAAVVAGRDHHRHHRRPCRRLPARLGRHADLAPRRYPAGLSLPDLRHRPDGDDGAGPAQHHPGAGLQGVGHPLPRRAGRDAGRARAGICRGGARARRLQPPHHAARDPAQHPVAGDRRLDHPHGQHHHPRGEPVASSASACSRRPPPGARWSPTAAPSSWRHGG